jgi:hypothetical protein
MESFCNRHFLSLLFDSFLLYDNKALKTFFSPTSFYYFASPTTLLSAFTNFYTCYTETKLRLSRRFWWAVSCAFPVTECITLAAELNKLLAHRNCFWTWRNGCFGVWLAQKRVFESMVDNRQHNLWLVR